MTADLLLPWRGVVMAPPHGPAINTSVHEEEAARLSWLAAGRHVLEIGSAYGYSAIVMARAGALSVTAVDPHRDIPPPGISGELMEANLAALGVRDKVVMVRDYSGSALPRLAAEGRKFGLIFIDGDHQENMAAADAEMAVALLYGGGVLAFHDYGNPECPGVARALDRMFPDGPDRVTVTLWERRF